MADGVSFDDVRLWGIIVIALIGAIANLLKKLPKKNGPPEQPSSAQGGRPTPRRTARPVPPPRPPVKAEPVRRLPETRRRPITAPPVLARPRAAGPPTVPPESPRRGKKRPAVRAGAEVGDRDEPEVHVVGTSLGEPEHPTPSLSAEPVSRSRPNRVGDEVRQLLRNRTGLQAAFVLSEVLGPPVGLREERPA